MKDSLPLIRSVKSCVAGALVVALPYLFFLLPGQDQMAPLPALYAVLLTVYLLPAALCTVTMVCGVLPMGLGLSAALVSVTSLTGTPGLTLTSLYVLPILAAFLAVVALQIPFRKSCAVLVAVHVAALAAVYALAQRMAGGDLYNLAGNAAAEFLENWEMGDMMLYQMYGAGLLDLRSDLADSAVLQTVRGYQLSGAARTDLLLSVRTLVTGTMQALVPNQLISRSIIGGVACLLLPLRFGFLAEEKREFLSSGTRELTEDGKQTIRFPDLGMPPFSLWHLPRGVGWKVGAALAAGYLLRVSRVPALGIAGAMLYAAGSSVFAIQGAAAINFLQKSRGTRRVWRIVVPVFLMLTQILTFVGIFDQMSNFRRLRKPPEPKEDFDL